MRSLPEEGHQREKEKRTDLLIGAWLKGVRFKIRPERDEEREEEGAKCRSETKTFSKRRWGVA